MSQISPPIRIVLVAVIGLIAAWMLFLRPKTEEVPAPTPAPATAPGVTGLTNAVDKAKDASAASDEANEKLQQATGEKNAAAGKAGAKKDSATKIVTGRELPLEPLTAEQTKGLPKKVAKALDKRQVLVLGVFDTAETRWSRMATDDRRVRRELAKTLRYDGQVVRTTTSLGRLSALNAVVGDLNVSQTPSIVVVDRNRHAVVLNGFVERNAINQAIADARRNSTEVRITDPFVRSLNRTCANFELRADRFRVPTTQAQVQPAIRQLSRIMATYSGAFASLDAPKKYRPLKRQVNVLMTEGENALAALRAGDRSGFYAAWARVDRAGAGLDRKFADAGATSCVGNRTK